MKNQTVISKGISGTIEFSEFKKFASSLKIADKDIKKFCGECAKFIANRLLRKVTSKTPVLTGHLKRGWVGLEGTMADEPLTHRYPVGESLPDSLIDNFVNSLPIAKVGNTYSIEIQNKTFYASFVEYGHRSTGGGWVPGRFFLTISEDELQNELPKLLEYKLLEFLRRLYWSQI